MKISLHIGAKVELEEFSLSQAVGLIKKVFANEGLPGFLRVYLEHLIVRSSQPLSGSIYFYLRAMCHGVYHC